SVRATINSRGPNLPVFARMGVVQQFPDGSLQRTRLKARGRARSARIDVEVSSDGLLADWVVPGSHHVAVLDKTRFSVGVVRPFCPGPGDRHPSVTAAITSWRGVLRGPSPR